MTGCSRKEDLVSRLLSKENPDEAEAEDLDHLKSCPDCQQAYAQIKAFEKEMKNISQELTEWGKISWSSPSPSKKFDFFAWFEFSWGWVGGFIVLIVLVSLLTFSKIEKGSKKENLSFPFPVSENEIKLISGSLLLDKKVISTGNPLKFGKQTVTCVGKTQLQISDGIFLIMDSASFRISQNELALDSGKAEIVISRKGTIFSVVTPTAVLSVRGTKFSVSVSNGTTFVKVLEGEIAVNSISGEKCFLKAGKGLSISPSGSIKDEIFSPTSLPPIPGDSEPKAGIGSTSNNLLNE